jgi:Rod binding domain-containing protein
VFQREDSSGDAVFEMAEQQFAQALAQSGGMGLARLITSGLRLAEPSDTSADPGRPDAGTS